MPSAAIGSKPGQLNVALGPLSSDRTEAQALREFAAHGFDAVIIELVPLRSREQLWGDTNQGAVESNDDLLGETPQLGDLSGQDEPASGTVDDGSDLL